MNFSWKFNDGLQGKLENVWIYFEKHIETIYISPIFHPQFSIDPSQVWKKYTDQTFSKDYSNRKQSII